MARAPRLGRGARGADTPPLEHHERLDVSEAKRLLVAGRLFERPLPGVSGDPPQGSVTGAPTRRKRLESMRRACDSLAAMLLMPGDDRVST